MNHFKTTLTPISRQYHACVVPRGPFNWLDKSEIATWLIPGNQMQKLHNSMIRKRNAFLWNDKYIVSMSCIRRLNIDYNQDKSLTYCGNEIYFVSELQRNPSRHCFSLPYEVPLQSTIVGMTIVWHELYLPEWILRISITSTVISFCFYPQLLYPRMVQILTISWKKNDL